MANSDEEKPLEEKAVERRTLLKTALGAGAAVAAGLASARTAAAQAKGVPLPTEVLHQVTGPLEPVCEILHTSVQQICPTGESPSPEPLEPNQVEITVPKGRDVIILEAGEPAAEVAVRISRPILASTKRPILTLIPQIFRPE